MRAPLPVQVQISAQTYDDAVATREQASAEGRATLRRHQTDVEFSRVTTPVALLGTIAVMLATDSLVDNVIDVVESVERLMHEEWFPPKTARARPWTRSRPRS